MRFVGWDLPSCIVDGADSGSVSLRTVRHAVGDDRVSTASAFYSTSAECYGRRRCGRVTRAGVVVVGTQSGDGHTWWVELGGSIHPERMDPKDRVHLDILEAE